MEEQEDEYVPISELKKPKKKKNGGGFFSKVGEGLKKAWGKTVFPEKMQAAKEEKQWKREIQAEAKKQARVDLKDVLVEKYKKEELDKMSGKKKKGNFLDKLAKGFETPSGKGGSGNDKIMKAFSLSGTDGNDDEISKMLGTGRGVDNDHMNKILGTSKKKTSEMKKTKNKKGTKKKSTNKPKTEKESVEDKIKRMLS